MSTCEEMTKFKIGNSCCRKINKCIQMLVVHVQVGSNHPFTLSFSFLLFFRSFIHSIFLSFFLIFFISTLQHFLHHREVSFLRCFSQVKLKPVCADT